jgi:hypothetical protein
LPCKLKGRGCSLVVIKKGNEEKTALSLNEKLKALREKFFPPSQLIDLKDLKAASYPVPL